MHKLSGYKFLFLKILFYGFAGTIMFISVNFIFQIYYDYPEEYNISQHIGTIFLTALITEGLFFIDSRLKDREHNKRGIFRYVIVKTLIYLFFVITVVCAFSIAIMLVFASDDRVIITLFDLVVINLVAIIYSISVLLVFSLYKTNRNLKDSQIKMERFKKERAEAKFHAMKMQLSPHFLFNTLNTLYGIIDKNRELAKDYLLKISDIYRYVLANENNELIELQKELDFVRDYGFLISKRFCDAFELSIDVPGRLLNKQIPPLTMQILVENALKHNILDKSNKLYISVYIENDNELVVKNNITSKKDQEITTGLGLQNLNNRYRYLDNREILIDDNRTEFVVKIPLINVENYAGVNN